MAAVGATARSGTSRDAAPALQSALMGLGTSQSTPTLRGSAAALARPLPGVSMQSLMKFLKPSSQENPDSVGRLELFAKYGPCDEDGKLRGGVGGAHVHQDIEIKEMIKHNCREALFGKFKRDRRTVEAIVDSLMPSAMREKYTERQIKQLLRNVSRNEYGRMDFTAMQDTILESQRQRLQVLVKRAQDGKPIAPPAERPPKVPFQSKSAATLLSLGAAKTNSLSLQDSLEAHEVDRIHQLSTQRFRGSVDKHQFREMCKTGAGSQSMDTVHVSKKLNAYSTLCGSLEDQSMAEELRQNVTLCRGLGPLNDRWDRYCALRRVGRSSYVSARNTHRFNAAMDEGISNKHPGCSSLLAASAGGSSAAAILGAA